MNPLSGDRENFIARGRKAARLPSDDLKVVRRRVEDYLRKYVTAEDLLFVAGYLGVSTFTGTVHVCTGGCLLCKE